MDTFAKKSIIEMQTNEITEYHVYSRLSGLLKDRENAAILKRIGVEEKHHHDYLATLTGVKCKPVWLKVFFYVLLARIFGYTFALKLMERGEVGAQETYTAIGKAVPGLDKIIKDEDEHEAQLLGMLKEERLEYVGSIVLGLNDALVELTGALAGLTFALQNTRLVAVAGLITGIAASFSMAASEYLSHRTDEKNEGAIKAAIYTGIAYIITVALLITPYLLFSHYLLCLGTTLGIAILVIFFFNYYISVAKDLKFWPRFLEMSFLSLGVAAISFGIGVLVRNTLGIEV